MPKASWWLVLFCSLFAFLVGYVSRDVGRGPTSSFTQPKIDSAGGIRAEKMDIRVDEPKHSLAPNSGQAEQPRTSHAEHPNTTDPKTAFEAWVTKNFSPMNVRVKPFGSLFFKKAWLAKDVRYDIQKTNSLVSPYVGILNCRVVVLEGETTHKTSEQALNDENLQTVDSGFWGKEISIRAHVAYQENKWIIKTLEYEDDNRFKVYEPGGWGPTQCQHLWKEIQD